MFAPTACTTPTRLPTLMWSLAAALVLLSAFAPALASEAEVHGGDALANEAGLLQVGSWRVLPLDRMLHTAVLRRAHGAPSRLMPLAVLPSHHSALWFGLSVSRASGARVELRWTMPLDGSAPNLRGFER
jgi:hypothetical protein